MSPPNRRGRPPTKGGPSVEAPATGDLADCSMVPPGELVEAQARTGKVVRITYERVVRCACSCGLVLENTGAAASHARSARHVVHVDYSTSFSFVPTELARRGGQ